METSNPFDVGVVTISLDTELAWGNISNNDYSGVGRRFEETSEAAMELLDLFEEYRIPVTWALVGQLFRDVPGSHRDTAGIQPFPDDTTPPWERDWWRAPELIQAIDESPVDHEIASHSGTHLVYADADRSDVRKDLSLFRELAADYEPITSFVFPKNSIAHLDLIAEHGFEQYRGEPPLLGSEPSPTTFLPRRHDGVVNIPGSAALRHFKGRNPILSKLPNSVKLAGLKIGTEHAIRRGRVFHLILHPSDFTLVDGLRLLGTLEEFLSYLQNKRRSGCVEVRTMAGVTRLSEF